MSMGKRGRPPSVSKRHYKAWLAEEKHLEGGKLTLCKPDGSDIGNWFPARRFGSEALPEEDFRELCMYGYSNLAGGFKVKAVQNERLADFLLMAHIDHHDGPLVVDGVDYGDHPHFHEWEWFGQFPRPDNVQRVPELIQNKAGILPEDFVEAFSQHYKFKTHPDGFEVGIDNNAPEQPKGGQSSLRIFDENGVEKGEEAARTGEN